MRLERWTWQWLAARVALSAILLFASYWLFLTPLDLCIAPLGEVSPWFPCDPSFDRVDGVLYLAYATGTAWVFLMAVAPTVPLALLARVTGRITLCLALYLLLAHLPDFIVVGAYRDMDWRLHLADALRWSPLILFVLTKPILHWPWLWRPDRDGMLTRGQKFRLAVLFPAIAFYLSHCMAVVDLNPGIP